MKTLLNGGVKKSYELGPGKVNHFCTKSTTILCFSYSLLFLYNQSHFLITIYQVIAGILKRMDKGAALENIAA